MQHTQVHVSVNTVVIFNAAVVVAAAVNNNNTRDYQINNFCFPTNFVGKSSNSQNNNTTK